LRRTQKKSVGNAELVVQARRGKYLPINNRLKQFFSGMKEVSKFVALKETNFNMTMLR